MSSTEKNIMSCNARHLGKGVWKCNEGTACGAATDYGGEKYCIHPEKPANMESTSKAEAISFMPSAAFVG